MNKIEKLELYIMKELSLTNRQFNKMFGDEFRKLYNDERLHITSRNTRLMIYKWKQSRKIIKCTP